MSRSALLMSPEDIKYIAAIKDNNKIITKKIDALRGDESKVDALRGDESNIDALRGDEILKINALRGDEPISDTSNSRKKDTK